MSHPVQFDGERCRVTVLLQCIPEVSDEERIRLAGDIARSADVSVVFFFIDGRCAWSDKDSFEIKSHPAGRPADQRTTTL